MSDFDFSFEQSPWEMTLSRLRRGGTLSAARFLTLMEEEEEGAIDGAAEDLEEMQILLDISDLPKFEGTGASAMRLRREEQFDGKASLELEENDPLRLFLEELSAPVSAEEAESLAAQYRSGNTRAGEKLASGMLANVVNIAAEYVGRGVFLLDLIQEGSLGLWESILRYEGGGFVPFAEGWIRRAMAKTVTLQARSNGIGRKLRDAMEEYRQIDDRLLTELGRNATLEEISQQMHISPEDGAVIEKMVRTAQLLQKAKTDSEPKQDDPDEEQAVEDTAYFQSRQRILEMLSVLDETDARVLSLRFGLEGGLPLPTQETGEKLGLTPEEVVRREAAALSVLRQNQE